MKKIAFLLLIAGMLAPAAIAQTDNTYLSFPGKNGLSGSGKNIVFISGDEEYRSEEGLPMLAKILSQRQGFNTTVLFSLDPTGSYIDPNNQKSISHPELIAKADLVIIQTRFRQWAPAEYQYFYDFLNAGKPVIGLRTATHAFTGGGKTGDFKWADFGLNILGEQWINHHGNHRVQGDRAVVEPANAKNPILNHATNIFTTTDVYATAHVNDRDDTILFRGAVTESLDPNSKPIEGPKNNPMMPTAWLHEYTAPNGTAKGKAFCTTMGASVDFKNEDLRRLVVNAAYSLLGMHVPAKANVNFVDPYEPTMYGFNSGADFYKKRNFQVSEQALGHSASTGPKDTSSK